MTKLLLALVLVLIAVTIACEDRVETYCEKVHKMVITAGDDKEVRERIPCPPELSK